MFLSNQSHAGSGPRHVLSGVTSLPNLGQLRHRIETTKAHDRLGREARLARLDALIGCGAWTDLAFELLALAAPNWHLQRLCLDGEEWVCTLCRRPRLPDWLDETVEVRAISPALAIVDAVLAAN